MASFRNPPRAVNYTRNKKPRYSWIDDNIDLAGIQWNPAAANYSIATL